MGASFDHAFENLMNRNAAMIVLLAASATLAHASYEGFADVPALFASGGWAQSNLSNPVGPVADAWGQGDPSQFAAQAGLANTYIAANFNATGDNGTISAWLLAPTQTFNNGDHLRFFTRTAPGSTIADRLQVRFSTAGSSANVGADENSVGDFTTLLADINPNLDASGYPDDWSFYDLAIGGLSGATSGRLGFRYFVTDAGSLGANSNIVALDGYNVQAVPEPATMAALGLGLAAFARRRRTAK